MQGRLFFLELLELWEINSLVASLGKLNSVGKHGLEYRLLRVALKTEPASDKGLAKSDHGAYLARLDALNLLVLVRGIKSYLRYLLA